MTSRPAAAQHLRDLAWLHHMLASLDAVAGARATPVEAVTRIRAYLSDVANFLVNTR